MDAYLVDVPSPLKKKLSQFSEFENKMEVAIGERFGVDPALLTNKELKRADTLLLIDEKAVLMVTEPEAWPPGAPSVKDTARNLDWGPAKAKDQVLARFKELI